MRFLLSILFLICTGCNHYGLLVHQQNVDRKYLASTHVGSPDPRQCYPPIGKMVILEWWIPKALMECCPKIVLEMIFWNFTKRTIEFPITKRIGYHAYDLLNEDFETTGGILTYKAEIVTGDGQIYREWKHQLWVNLIELGESRPSIEPSE